MTEDRRRDIFILAIFYISSGIVMYGLTRLISLIM